jgi:hypothetical protein
MAGWHPTTESQTMKKTPRKLSRELAWIIGIKVVLLLIIWKAFVAPYQAHVDADAVADNMLDAHRPANTWRKTMLDNVVDLSRLQFAVTALYHFLFVPLTIGMVWLLVIMEAVWVMTGKQVYQDMTRFWGKLFGINFALGVTTGITMEFQFGTNWAYYSHYVGDILARRWRLRR